MKRCRKCEELKSFDNFYVDIKLIDGRSNSCKDCQRKLGLERSRTKLGLISKIYSSQKSHSKIRDNNPPEYSLSELQDWVMSKPIFHKLYSNWVDSGYITNLIPSLDRSDDTLGYSLERLTITTWDENRKRLYKDRVSGKHTKSSKEVNQLTMDGILVNKHFSISSAARSVSTSQGSISDCCLGNIKSSKGFRWEYANKIDW